MASFDLVVNGKPKISRIGDYRISNILDDFHIDFMISDPETVSPDLDILPWKKRLLSFYMPTT